MKKKSSKKKLSKKSSKMRSPKKKPSKKLKFYGDAVTLEAVVFGANMEYVVRWEAAGEDGEWFAVAEGSNVYEFVLTEETAAMQYRAVLVAVEL